MRVFDGVICEVVTRGDIQYHLIVLQAAEILYGCSQCFASTGTTFSFNHDRSVALS